MSLDAMKQALEALERGETQLRYEAIEALRAAIEQAHDWDEVEALRASLREHMAEIHRLHEANQLMLDTLRWIDKLCSDEFHYFDKQKPGLQRVLAKMAYDAGGLARSTIEKVEEI